MKKDYETSDKLRKFNKGIFSLNLSVLLHSQVIRMHHLKIVDEIKFEKIRRTN